MKRDISIYVKDILENMEVRRNSGLSGKLIDMQ